MRLVFASLALAAVACSPTAINPPSTPDAASDVAAMGDLGADDVVSVDAPVVVDAPAPEASVDVPAAPDVAADVPVTDAPLVDAPTSDMPAVDAISDAATRCTADAQCAAPTSVCDRARGVCVECASASTCGAGRVCASNRCVAAVACTSSRMCPGQVCDLAAGRCVDCTADVDCPTGERCLANLCAPPPRSCASSRECSEFAQVCHPTMRVCVDCAADTDCPMGYCAADTTCRPRACEPNQRTCVGADRVSVCDARGTSATVTACGMNEVCVMGACLARVCAPGAFDCASDGARRQCTSDGLGYTPAPCAAGLNCSAGACVAGCPTGLTRCGAACVDLRSDRTNCGACGAACGAGTSCVAASSGCVAACVADVATATLPTSGLILRMPAGATARVTVGAAGREAAYGEDTARQVAWVVGRFSASPPLESVTSAVEVPLAGATGARALLAQQSITLNDGSTARYGRFVTRCESASRERDRLATALSLPPSTGATVGVGSECVVEYLAALRGDVEALVTYAVAERGRFEGDEASAAAVRDFALYTLPNRAAPASVCASFTAAAPVPVDVVWSMDTSASLTPYQARVGRGSTNFVNRLVAVGADARVAVFQASAATPNLDTPGLTWANVSAGGAANAICNRLTSNSLGTCPLTGSADTENPYPVSGGGEEPVANAIEASTALARRAAMGEVNPDRRFRAGARVVTIGLTDEPGTNDWSRYFATRSAPDTMTPWGTTWNDATMNAIAAWFTRNQVTPYGFYRVNAVICRVSVNELPRCVTSAAGGANAEIVNATDADVAASLTLMADGVAAVASPVRLASTPLPGTLVVRVRSLVVPPSHTDGYAYDPARRALVFYGLRYRPTPGDPITVTYAAN